MNKSFSVLITLTVVFLSLAGCNPVNSKESSLAGDPVTEEPVTDPAVCTASKGVKTVPDIKLPSIFSTSMIFARNMPINVYGEAPNGTDVTVELSSNEGKPIVRKTTASAENGSFIVSFPATRAGTGYIMTVKNGEKTLTYTDVSVGEVFLCGGQSNMRLQMGDTTYYKQYYKDLFSTFTDTTDIRQFVVEVDNADEPKTDCSSVGWRPATSKYVERFSPLTYFFALRVHEELDVPVGIVQCAVNGSPIESWMPAEVQDSVTHSDSTGVNYNAMVAPLMPYSYTAVLWYQGESNATSSAFRYGDQLCRLITHWRNDLYAPDIPFYVAELAGWRDDRYAAVREQQRAAADSMNKIYLIANTDLGDRVDNHPRTKEELARRFALAFFSTYHGIDTAYQAPTLKSARPENRKMIVTFDHVYHGLKTKDGGPDVNCFQLAGSDGIYYPRRR